nr:LamG domain-containing protein [Rhodothermaceae bacterium]
MKAPRNQSFNFATKLITLFILFLSHSALYVVAQSVNFNTALVFDGVDDSIVVPRNEAFNFDASDNFTVEVWLKYSGRAGTGLAEPDIIEFWQNLGGPYPFVLRGESHANAGKLVFSRFDGTSGVSVSSSRSNLNDDTWHHVAIVHDGTAKSMTIYIDGVLDSSSTYTSLGSTKTTVNDLYFASRGLTGNNFGGQMDDVRIWNVARSQEQIANTRYSLLTGAESGLVGYWPFNEGSGNTVTDLTGGSNGTLTNMAPSSWVP